jgi:hypothetical protein
VLIVDRLSDFSSSAPVYMKFDSRSRLTEVITRGISEGPKQRGWWVPVFDLMDVYSAARVVDSCRLGDSIMYDTTATFKRDFILTQ